MKKERNFFSGIKSVYFMLFACLTLSICVTSCSSDEFETNLPEEQRQYTKAELIEQALSRMPQTRSSESTLVSMVTIKKTVTIRGVLTDSVKIQFDKDTTIYRYGTDLDINYKFTDDNLSHYICIMGSESAIRSLTVDNNELISLDIKSNENLGSLSCANNHLDELDLSRCKNLATLNISNNEFTSIDLTCLPELLTFSAVNNWLTELNVSANPNIFDLYIENNQIRELDFSGNPILYILEAQNNPLKVLNFKNEILGYLDLSYTQITDLDLSECKALWAIILEETPIKTLNNQVINDTSFLYFDDLQQLNIAYTSFAVSNLLVGSSVILIDISGSAITQLDISNGQMMYLYATRSKLTTLIYEENDLNNLFEVRIERTPFEKDWKRLKPFVEELPSRNGTAPGHLYTYSEDIDKIAGIILQRNWLINT
ncbi:MAG: hypothetical protein NC410_11055 [Oscillibacter sp.]|nr:hypothetical protein [Oscillibacter sp.]